MVKSVDKIHNTRKYVVLENILFDISRSCIFLDYGTDRTKPIDIDINYSVAI